MKNGRSNDMKSKFKIYGNFDISQLVQLMEEI